MRLKDRENGESKRMKLATRITCVSIACLLWMVHLVSPASAATATLTADADAFVDAGSASRNYGDSSLLRVRADVRVSYIRFNVPSVPSGEQVETATLEIYARSRDACSLGVEVFRAASDSWKESTINWKNQPGTIGGALATDGASSSGYRTFDVSTAVSGGPVSFAVRYPGGCKSSDELAFSSREAGTKPPRLIVRTGPEAASACSDDLDNDGDGLTDYPSDPGCTTASDTDEADAPATGSRKLVAAGDIVCSPSFSAYDGSSPDQCQHRLTDDLLGSADAVVPLGDLQYPDGLLQHFNEAYDPTWGRFAPKTYPVPGNHEYHTAGAQGYFAYWSAQGRPVGVTGDGYYSYDLGAWHVIALNSSASCSEGPSCAEGSPQNDWLEADLAATTERCILAYWHHPRFNSGTGHGETLATGALWEDLYTARADVVLNGHEHNFQRYAKQDPAGRRTSAGIRQFIVGTGGRSLTDLGSADPSLEAGIDTAFGVLELTLASTSYAWRYISVTGAVLDSGGPVSCN